MLLLQTLFLVLLPLLAYAAEDYYKLLGIDRDATDRELKKAYRRISKKHHPDKNQGDEKAHQKFVEIANAYEVLVDPELRRIYNQHGHEGVEQHRKGGGGNRGHHDPFDLFSRFFGGGGHYQQGERRGPNMEVRVAMPLRDFYNGAEHEIAVEKQAICSTCEGSGSEDGKTEKCGQCDGHGRILRRQQIMPGMVQQVQMQCDVCAGKGTVIKHKCKTCGGARVIREVESHRLHIEKGFPSSGRMTVENEGDESPDWTAGDLLVELVEADPVIGDGSQTHDQSDGTFFRRKGNDLFWDEVLSLREAWMGEWTRNLTHLDGHVVKLSRSKGDVVQPGMVQMVKNEGMPVHNHEEGPEFGDLYVEYTVVLPDQAEKGMLSEFGELFEKWRKKAINLEADTGHIKGRQHDEL